MKKKILSAALAATMLGTISASASAHMQTETEVVNMNYSIDEYIEETLPTYLAANNFSENSNYSVSEYYEIHNYDFGGLRSGFVFVACDGDVAGKMKIDIYDDGIYSYFDTSISNDFQDVFDNGDKVAVTIYENQFIAVTESSAFALEFDSDVNYNGDTIENMVSLSETNVFNYVEPTPIRVSDMEMGGISLMSTLLATISFDDMQIVSNVDYDGNGNYICWAACVAMAINYMENNTTHYTARNIADSVNSHEGDSTDVLNAYNNYGYTATYLNDAATPNTVYQQMRNDRPVQVNIYGSVTRDAHAVMIKKIQLYNDKTTYTILDPSKTSTATTPTTVTVEGNPTQKSVNFVYNPVYSTGVFEFDTWYRTYY